MHVMSSFLMQRLGSCDLKQEIREIKGSQWEESVEASSVPEPAVRSDWPLWWPVEETTGVGLGKSGSGWDLRVFSTHLKGCFEAGWQVYSGGPRVTHWNYQARYITGGTRAKGSKPQGWGFKCPFHLLTNLSQLFKLSGPLFLHL